MTPGVWILLASLLLAVAFGAWRAYADGRFRGTHAVRGFETGAARPPRPPDSPVVETPGVETRAQPATPVVEEGRQGPSRNHAGQPPLLPPDQLGERATLLQFSSAFCAPCRATRRVLADVAAVVPGVVHVEIDAERHLDLVRRVNVLRTPTTLVLDADGHEVTRAAGAPRKEQVLTALARIGRPHHGSASQGSGQTDE